MVSTVEQIKRRRVQTEFSPGMEEMAKQHVPPDVGTKDARLNEEAARIRDAERVKELEKFMDKEKAADYIKRNPSK